MPIVVEPIGPSTVERPDPAEVDPGGVAPGIDRPPDEATPSQPEAPSDVGVIAALLVAMGVVLVLALGVARRAERRQR